MDDFVLLGHDNPLGKYPAPVIPVGQLNGDLVAIFPGGTDVATTELIQEGCVYVPHHEALRRKLENFNYHTDRLFAYDERDVTFFPSEHEKEFLRDFLLQSKSKREDSFVRLLLAKQTRDLPLIVKEMGFCSQILLEEAPSFARRWCVSEFVEVYAHIDVHRLARETGISVPGRADEVRPLILIADDDRAIVDAYSTYLENAGYRVTTAYDGDEALDRVHQERPRLILLDIFMPKKSGLEVLEELKRDPMSKEIPVIVMTGNPLEIQDTSSGANLYLQKGIFSLDELRKYAETLLDKRKVG
jgi:CheY-like chemotaxis protein